MFNMLCHLHRPLTRSRTLRSMCVLLCLTAMVGACDESTSEPPLLAIAEVSGANQIAGAGTALNDSIVVHVSQNGRPARGVEVQWRPIAGGGTVDRSVSLTDSLGNAWVRWTLGDDPGQNLLLASAGGASLSLRASALFRIAKVAVGFRHSCALSTTGVAYCWGSNSHGQLGDGTDRARGTPTRVALGFRFKHITAGWTHTCAISRFDELFCWGDNSSRQLGTTSSAIRAFVPTMVQGSDLYRDASAGYIHTCAVTVAGASRCWGESAQGQLGSASVPGLTQISAGEFHSCALRTDNAALCWGWNTSGELGTNAPYDAIVPAATQTFGSTRFTKVAAGVRHTCAIATDGQIYCWGRNAFGETGQDPFNHVPVPAPVAGATGYSEIGTGNVHTCGLSNQRAYCWGATLGNGTRNTSKVPVQVSSSLAFTALAVGFDRTCGVADGEVWCWGGPDLSPVKVVVPQ
jgi:alpha-tubulin suppressor-like RCC1 family protein